MTFTLIDVVLIILVVIFITAGYILGFIHTLGAFVGAVVGIFVASRLALPLGASIGDKLGNETVVTIVLFAIIYLIVSRLVGLLFMLVEKSFGVAKVIPFVKPINSLLGALFGFFEGVITVGAVVYFAGQLLPTDWIQNIVQTSQVGNWILTIFDLLKGLLPEVLRRDILGIE